MDHRLSGPERPHRPSKATHAWAMTSHSGTSEAWHMGKFRRHVEAISAQRSSNERADRSLLRCTRQVSMLLCTWDSALSANDFSRYAVWKRSLNLEKFTLALMKIGKKTRGWLPYLGAYVLEKRYFSWAVFYDCPLDPFKDLSGFARTTPSYSMFRRTISRIEWLSSRSSVGARLYERDGQHLFPGANARRFVSYSNGLFKRSVHSNCLNCSAIAIRYLPCLASMFASIQRLPRVWAYLPKRAVFPTVLPRRVIHSCHSGIKHAGLMMLYYKS